MARTPAASAAAFGPASPAASPARIAGLDLARFVAVAGMMAAHVWTITPSGEESLAAAAVSGKAAGLFAVLAGAGIALTSRRGLAAGRVGAARRNLFGRGLALVIIGLTLGLAPSGVLVILVFYGVLFWVAMLLVRWSDRALLIGAAALGLIGPVATALLRAALARLFGPPAGASTPSWPSLRDPLALLQDVLLTGAYPVLTWVVYAMVGMLVGRVLLRASDAGSRARAARRLAVVGAVAALGGWGVSALLAGPIGALAALEAEPAWLGRDVEGAFYASGYGTPPPGSLWWLASPAPHTGTPFDLAITTGVALVVIALCLAAGAALHGIGARLVEPVRRAGAAPLTIYTLHVLATAVTGLVRESDDGASWGVAWYVSSPGMWALHVAGAVLVGVVLLLLDRRGPLETFVSWSGRLFSRTPRA